jgi:hypothetical protein
VNTTLNLSALPPSCGPFLTIAVSEFDLINCIPSFDFDGFNAIRWFVDETELHGLLAEILGLLNVRKEK